MPSSQLPALQTTERLFISTLSGSMTSMRPSDLVSPAVAYASAISRSVIGDLRREPRSAGQLTESETSSFIIIPVQMVEYIQARLWRSSAFLSQTLQADSSKTDWSRHLNSKLSGTRCEHPLERLVLDR